MKNLPKCPAENVTVLQDTIAAKHRATRDILSPLTDSILASYERYSKAAPRLEALSPLRLDDDSGMAELKSKALRHCYDSPTRPVTELVANLFADLSVEDSATCCYCLIGPPDTIDHYLPKRDWPEFSIYADNMVPVCWQCNHIKDEHAISNAGQRLFLHTYFDDIPETTFLYCEITAPDPVPTTAYSVADPDAIIDPYLFGVVSRHFQGLDLATRYQIQANALLGRTIDMLQAANLKGSEAVTLKAVIDRQARLVEPLKGRNHWETALYRALANCPIDWLLR